jgi:hypothetical protein
MEEQTVVLAKRRAYRRGGLKPRGGRTPLARPCDCSREDASCVNPRTVEALPWRADPLLAADDAHLSPNSCEKQPLFA